MPISVIIPTYQSPEYLDVCLESIFKTQTLNNQIIVVVDGFINLNKEILNKYPQVEVLDLEINRGLSISTNWGVYNSKYDDILIVNDDNVFCNNWDVNLLNKAQKGWVWAVNQIEPNPSIFSQFYIKDLGKTPKEFNLDKFLNYADIKNEDKVENNGSTLPIFMKREDYLSVGGWDIMYPSPHVVDWDFFLKCNNYFKMWRTFNVNFYHFAGASTRRSLKEDIKSTQKEKEAHEFAKLKWGKYIKHNPKNNIKYL